MRLSLLLAFLSAALPAAAQEAGREQICALKPCRESRPLQIWLDQNRYLEVDLGGTVIAHELNVSVYPGETHFITARMSDRQIVDLVPLTVGTTEANGLSVSMSQEKTKDGELATLLKVTNLFGLPLRYEAYMDMDGSNEFRYTSSCPVGPGLTSYEHWPHAVVQIVMTNVRLLLESESDGDAVVCE